MSVTTRECIILADEIVAAQRKGRMNKVDLAILLKDFVAYANGDGAPYGLLNAIEIHRKPENYRTV